MTIFKVNDQIGSVIRLSFKTKGLFIITQLNIHINDKC